MVDPIALRLDLLAARLGDPAPRVHARSFAAHPKAEALFLVDGGCQVRGEMPACSFGVLLDDTAGEHAAGLLPIERMNLANLGVPPAPFDRVLPLLMALVRDMPGADWTLAMDAAWQARVAGRGALTRPPGLSPAPAPATLRPTILIFRAESRARPRSAKPEEPIPWPASTASP